MSGPPPTGRDLYERLCGLLGVETEEDLAHELGISPRQVQRIKAGFGPNQQRLIDLLTIAGWIATSPKISRDEAAERARVFASAKRLERRARRSGQGTPLPRTG